MHVKGRPDARISSSDGIPVDVTYVGIGPGRILVPRGRLVCFEVTRLLNEDISEEEEEGYIWE